MAYSGDKGAATLVCSCGPLFIRIMATSIGSEGEFDLDLEDWMHAVCGAAGSLLDSKRNGRGKQEKSGLADGDWGEGIQASQDLGVTREAGRQDIR